jgi:4-hydroxythreonine-4-phosphate dehydrogenase|tara:strand:+ start:14578 stop:15549 length:972 start_codon:yes stop_codon:yes gene_type:complete
LIKRNIVVSLGDPSGIGAEVFLKSVTQLQLNKYLHKFFVVCDPQILEKAFSRLGTKVPYIKNENLENVLIGKLNVTTPVLVNDYDIGVSNKTNSEYVVKNLDIASKIAEENKFCMITGPINKSIASSFKKNFRGHTEYLQYVTKSSEVLMVLSNPKMRIGLVTTHIPISDVPEKLTQELILNKARIFLKGLHNFFGITNPHICVLALNPHAGENGTIGNEEKKIIEPAIKLLQSEGLRVSGPLSADTAFLKQDYDGFLSMFHDQALPVIKTIDFKKTVNITFGLPYPRISVDHGTAEDIASKFIADPSSMTECIKIAGNVHKF